MLVLIIAVLFLTGCSTIFDLTDWTAPNDLEFLQVTASLDTPLKIEAYGKANFEYKANYFLTPDPYEFWKAKKGDCNDFETWQRYTGNTHNFETYRIIVWFKFQLVKHAMAIFVEYGRYNYFNVKSYKEIYVDTFKKVAEHYKLHNTDYTAYKYKVYDWYGNIVEEGGI